MDLFESIWNYFPTLIRFFSLVDNSTNYSNNYVALTSLGQRNLKKSYLLYDESSNTLGLIWDLLCLYIILFDLLGPYI